MGLSLLRPRKGNTSQDNLLGPIRNRCSQVYMAKIPKTWELISRKLLTKFRRPLLKLPLVQLVQCFPYFSTRNIRRCRQSAGPALGGSGKNAEDYPSSRRTPENPAGGSVKYWKRLACGDSWGNKSCPSSRSLPAKRGLDEITQEDSFLHLEKKEKRYAQKTPEFESLLVEAVEQPR